MSLSISVLHEPGKKRELLDTRLSTMSPCCIFRQVGPSVNVFESVLSNINAFLECFQ